VPITVKMKILDSKLGLWAFQALMKVLSPSN
jgi:hypothetical protein